MSKSEKKQSLPYFRLYFNSFAFLFKNPALILPTLLKTATALGFGIIVLLELLVLYLINGSLNLFQPVLPITIVNCSILICFIVFDIFLAVSALILITFYFPSIRIGMIKEIIDTEGRTSVNKIWQLGKRYFRNYLKCYLVVLVAEKILYVTVGGIIKVFPLIGWIMLKHFTSYYGVFPGIILIFFVFGFLLLIPEMFLLFFEPVLVQINESSGLKGILKSTLKYSNRNPFKAIVVFVASYLIPAVIFFVSLALTGHIFHQIDSVFLDIIFIVIFVFIFVCWSLAMDIFVFQVYFQKQKLKAVDEEVEKS